MTDDRNSATQNGSAAEARAVLTRYRTVAVVGLSDRPDRDSHRVAAYLQRHGYRIIPINPAVTEVLGEKAYASLKDVPETIEIVDIFRKADAVLPIVDEALAVGAKAVWMQLGIVHEEAAAKARAAGLTVLMDRCIAVDLQHLSNEQSH